MRTAYVDPDTRLRGQLLQSAANMVKKKQAKSPASMLAGMIKTKRKRCDCVRSYTHAHKQSNNSQSVLYTSISELLYLSITHAQ